MAVHLYSTLCYKGGRTSIYVVYKGGRIRCVIRVVVHLYTLCIRVAVYVVL